MSGFFGSCELDEASDRSAFKINNNVWTRIKRSPQSIASGIFLQVAPMEQIQSELPKSRNQHRQRKRFPATEIKDPLQPPKQRKLTSGIGNEKNVHTKAKATSISQEVDALFSSDNLYYARTFAQYKYRT